MEESPGTRRGPGKRRLGVLRRTVGLLLALSLRAWAEPDYRLDSFQNTPPSSVPGQARGVLWQDEPGGPLRFSVDSHLVSNVYRLDPKVKGAKLFQVDSQGHKIALTSGFRSLLAQDLGKDAPRYALVDLEVNDGKGMRGLNGMLASRWQRLQPELVARVASLDKDVDKIAATLQSRIHPYFEQKLKGRETRRTEMTWLTQEKLLLVREARSVSGLIAPGNAHERRLRGQRWEVPYLTVVYRLKPDGSVISRKIVEPGEPVATARRYNPGGSPW